MVYKNVMVIDDSYFDRLIAEKVIRHSNFAENVITVDTAQKGIDSLQSCSDGDLPDVIFLDISMPGLDGFDFLELFEDVPESARENCKIFMLSSSVNPKDVLRANKSKYVFSFISKPLTPEKLAEL